MKLYATVSSERGKEVSKAGNDAICIRLTKDKCGVFDIMFDGDKIEVLRYFDASIETIEYVSNKYQNKMETESENA